MARACFISLDGIDGAGKSTQVRLLADWLRDQGFAATVCRDPGGTAAGDRIRQLLLDRNTGHLAALTETFLYMASRAQLVEEVIQPALNAGHVVLCDRFVLSTVVYQGYAGRLDPKLCWELGRIATAGILPDYTFILDMPATAAFARKSGPEDRMEDKGMAFLEQVRQGFLSEALKDSDQFFVIEAQQSVAAVQELLRQEVSRVLARHSRP